MQLYLPNVFYWERSWTWQASIENIKKNEAFLRQAYRKHISHVKSVVPAHRLLVWDVSTGWQPLCDFLNVKVPSSSFPKLNKTGDGFLMSEMGDVFQLAMPEFGRKKKMFYSSIFVASLAALYLITRKIAFH
ncbi:unnamed protein product [Oikopleura dioica]|nr:unnamed protein product [Oikopleura dioica]